MPKFNGNGNGEGKPEFGPGRDLEAIAAKHERALQKAVENKNAPPTIVEPRCHVCTSEYRQWVEAQLIKGHSYRSIENAMYSLDIPNEERIERRSISTHAKKHMSIDDAVIRAIIEAEADIEGKNYEDGVRGALSLTAALEVAVHKGFEDILSGNVIVEPRDLIQIVKLKMDMEERTSIALVDEAKRQVGILAQAIREEVPQQYLNAVLRKVEMLKLEQSEGSDVAGLIAPVVNGTANEL